MLLGRLRSNYKGHNITEEENWNVTLRNNILYIQKHQLSVIQSCPLIMKKLCFFQWKFRACAQWGTSNRTWMHSTRVSSPHYYFCGITYWCTMENAASNPDQCNTMKVSNVMNDLTMPCFCPFCPLRSSVCIPLLYLNHLVCTIVYGQQSLQSAKLAL